MRIAQTERHKSQNRKEGSFNPKSYLGTPRKYLGLNAKNLKSIASQWTKENKNISTSELMAVLDSLNLGETFEERIMVGSILGRLKNQRVEMNIEYLYKWLGNLEGWAEIDCLCQSSFSGEEVISRWSEWQKLLTTLNTDKNISRRRASLVLLCKAVRDCKDDRFAKLAFANVEKLKHEKEILITKAVSWILRNMTKNYKAEVKNYLDQNAETLPKIAVRETKRKLETGRK